MVLSFSSGDILESVELNNMLVAAKGDGIVDAASFAVTQRFEGTNMSVDVAGGEAWINRVLEEETSKTNLAIDASHVTLERKDLITYDASANIPAVVKGVNHAGTEADPTYPPDLPAGDILLGIVKVGAGVTTIVNGNITDSRIEVRIPKSASVRASNTLKDSDDSVENIPSAAYSKIKELGPVPEGVLLGTLRLSFSVNKTGVGSCYARVYRNGVAIGTAQEGTGTSYDTLSEDLRDWNATDTIELWAMHSAGTGQGNVKEFRAYGDFVDAEGLVTLAW